MCARKRRKRKKGEKEKKKKEEEKEGKEDCEKKNYEKKISGGKFPPRGEKVGGNFLPTGNLA